ncbi:GNAT family N-acetyltransferase [Solibacillus sp. FSL H8-0538]|uniref:GNAT family N-acetyltransferase n=1 Tax=Solibacillus sp. FSL H8-0538 TaxID=2921400 RepID=UPI0030FCF46A
MQFQPWSIDYIDGLVTLWNAELDTEFPMRKELFLQNSFYDVNVFEEGSFIALDDNGQVIGFVVSKTWQEKMDVAMDKRRGWIQTLLVCSDARHNGLGTMLLKKAEQALTNVGIKEIQLGGDPFHYLCGIPLNQLETIKLAEKHGYVKRIDTYDLVNELAKDYVMPAHPNVEYVLLKQEEAPQLIAFLQRCFPGRWEYEAMKYFEMGGTGREFVVLKKEGEIIGFCRINDDQSPMIAQNMYWRQLIDGEVGGIGPLGVDQNEQKQGYGLGIVQAGMAYLQQRSVETIIIDWTFLVEFYEKLDFNVWKSYGIYLKTMAEVGD